MAKTKTAVRGPQLDFLSAAQKRRGRDLVRMVGNVEQVADLVAGGGVVMFVRVPQALKTELEDNVRAYNLNQRQPGEPRRTLADEVTERLYSSLATANATAKGLKRGR